MWASFMARNLEDPLDRPVESRRDEVRRRDREQPRSGAERHPQPLVPSIEVSGAPARVDHAPRFANEAERECARLLDYYGVPWEYEPTTFVLEQDEDGRIVEAFKPDFYLPEQNLYVEVTVMKQSLVTRKNRKLRKLRERYPDVRVKLFYKRDIERLAERYGLELAS
jgi:hypothetical protein